MLPIILVMVLAVATAVPSPESSEGPNFKSADISYGGPDNIIRFDDSHKNQEHGWVPDADANKIIASVYSPAFLQPIWILDYRLTPLKGRDYKAEFGKPVLVLPRKIYKDEREHDDRRRDYDDRRRDYDDRRRDYDDDDKRDHNEGIQAIELNRLRELARGEYADKVHRPLNVELKSHSGIKKGYNPAWAPIPDVQFAGRNRFASNNH